MLQEPYRNDVSSVQEIKRVLETVEFVREYVSIALKIFCTFKAIMDMHEYNDTEGNIMFELNRWRMRLLDDVSNRVDVDELSPDGLLSVVYILDNLKTYMKIIQKRIYTDNDAVEYTELYTEYMVLRAKVSIHSIS